MRAMNISFGNVLPPLNVQSPALSQSLSEVAQRAAESYDNAVNPS
jgi:hypothetical protein